MDANRDSASWLAWTCDAFDFFCVSLSVNTLAKQFDKQPKEIVRQRTLLHMLGEQLIVP